MKVLYHDDLQARSLTDAQACLIEAKRRYQGVAVRAEEIRAEWEKREIRALKELNEAQVVFDRAVAAERVNAPLESDWGKQDNPNVAIMNEMQRAMSGTRK